MTILDKFILQSCTEEQSSLLLYCFETLSRLGLVEIEFNIDELLVQIENLDLFETLQCCYNFIKKAQVMAFEFLQIAVDNSEDIKTPMDILYYLDQLEDSHNHYLICNIIDDAFNPEEAFFSLLEEVLFVDTSEISQVVHGVSTGLMERLYGVHKSNQNTMLASRFPVAPIDERKLDILKTLWALPGLNSLRQVIRSGEFNLPISKSYWKTIQLQHVIALRGSQDKKIIAVALLEACLVMSTEWKDIKKEMKALSKEIFDDLLFISELVYVIDNICMEYHINGLV